MDPFGLLLAILMAFQDPSPKPAAVFLEITVHMDTDVDGAPNAYGPPDKPALDFEYNAHWDGKLDGAIVGYRTKADHVTPEVQGPDDPYPGYYISTTAFSDRNNSNANDPKKYVDATKINYVVMGTAARQGGARLGDFVAVFSSRHKKSAYAIIGDAGNPSGAEGSLALLQALGYPFQDGRRGVAREEITIRYYPGSNHDHHFFQTQAQIDEEAAALGLSKDFAPTQP